jgi:hypothetical protein
MAFEVDARIILGFQTGHGAPNGNPRIGFQTGHGAPNGNPRTGFQTGHGAPNGHPRTGGDKRTAKGQDLVGLA